MSIFSSLVTTVVKDVESAEKSAVVTTVKDEIATIITTNAPQTEEEAVALVNTNLTDITNNGIAAIKNPIIAELANLAKPEVTTWVEGIADGAVSEVFATIQADAAKVGGDNTGQGSNTVSLVA